MQPMLSIVIPSYNELDNIPNTIQAIQESISITEIAKNYQIIIVDDHSSDNTYGYLASLNDPQIQCIRLSRRSGSHIALRAGLAHAAGQAVLCMAADGQDDVSILTTMILKWRAGGQIIWALRKDRNDEARLNKYCAKIFYKILFSLCANQENGIDASRADFFLLDKSVVNVVNACTEARTSLFGLLLWMGFKQDSVEYDRKKRRSGHSKWNFKRKINLAVDWIIAFSPMPMRVFVWIGLIVMAGATLCGDKILSAVFCIGGLQVMAIGIIGEYLWRNLEQSRQRPLYFIEQKTSHEN